MHIEHLLLYKVDTDFNTADQLSNYESFHVKHFPDRTSEFAGLKHKNESTESSLEQLDGVSSYSRHLDAVYSFI